MDLKNKLLKGAASLTKIAVNAATGVDQIAPDNEVDKRMAKCYSCPSFNKALKQCKTCGCFLAVKAKIAHEVCPEGKWGAVEPKKS
jgi:hypothetical protein